jgi:hypothetical protein
MGFKPKDSIHLSCAIEANSPIFFTTDTGILKKADLISERNYSGRRELASAVF